MTRDIPLTVLFVLVLASAASYTAPSTGAAGYSTAPFDSYQVLWTRNIFARDRSVPRKPLPVSTQPSTQPAAGINERRMVLKGVGLQGPVRFAFFEDSQADNRIKVSASQPFGDGTIVSISLDHVEYERDSSTTKVSLGEEVTSDFSALSSTPATTQPSPGSTQEATSRPSDATGAGTNDTLEEQMRQRRLRELNP